MTSKSGADAPVRAGPPGPAVGYTNKRPTRASSADLGVRPTCSLKGTGFPTHYTSGSHHQASDDRLATDLRGFGPLGILAILAYFTLTGESRLVALAVLALFALRTYVTILQRRQKDRELAEQSTTDVTPP